MQEDNYFPVLDHGFIALKDMMGSDTAIEEMARVSYQAGTRKTSDTRGLLRYLMNHRHTSPFERVELVFHVGLPIFVARQWVRHRTASINEYSGRYSVMPMIFYTPDIDRVCTQNTENKQGSSEDKLNDYDAYGDSCDLLRNRMSTHYEQNLDQDMARELARLDLPLSMYTYWYWKIDLHNLFHFLSLRMDPHAQWEIQQYAHIIANMVKGKCPLAWEAFYDYRLNGCTFSRMEMQLLNHCMVHSLDLYRESDMIELIQMASQYGMTNREQEEFCSKLSDPDLTLHKMPTSLPAKHFQDKIEAAS